MGHVSIGVEVQRNTDGDTPSSLTIPSNSKMSLKIFLKKKTCS